MILSWQFSRSLSFTAIGDTNMHSLTATYSPEDNKLRLYSDSRLDPETYERVTAAGFRYASKQNLYVAPAWTPAREDLLLELCDEIGDEGTSLAERAEHRAERFNEYSNSRAVEAARTRTAVTAIADRIPFGQPILVGHHSESRARKDAERIQDGMRKTVNLWETSEYWSTRAAGALRHAKYKQLPAVRTRRIRTLEAEKRNAERQYNEAKHWLGQWTRQDLTIEEARKLANQCYLQLPFKHGDYDQSGPSPSAYDALNGNHPTRYAPRTLAEVVEAAETYYPRAITNINRWIQHFENRITYERAMLAEQGGLAVETKELLPGGRALVDGGWLLIVRVNKRQGRTVSITTDAIHHPIRPIEEIKDYQPPTTEAAAAVAAATAPAPTANYDGPDFVHLTKDEYKALPNDYKGLKEIPAGDRYGAHRVKHVLGSFLKPEQRRHQPAHNYYFVFITDDKRKDPPAPTPASADAGNGPLQRQ
jgi:hypothetical protein